MGLRPTLQQAIDQGVGKPLGICKQDIAENAAAVNLAEQQLITDPLAPDEGWVGGWATMKFNVNSSLGSSFFVTPHNVARVIVLDVCKIPIALRNGFYEYLLFGTGLQPKGCGPQLCQPNTVQAFERDSVSTLADFPATPQYLRFYPTNSADVGRRIVPQGNDQNGKPITATDIDTQTAAFGETIYMVSPFSTSINQFANVSGILKELTLGQVLIYTVDPTTGVSTYLSTMEPNETTAQYRRYFINGLPCNCCSTPGGVVQVSAKVKLDFVPLVNAQDYLNIPNIPAIYEQCQANRYGTIDSENASKLEAKHHARAIQLLCGQLDHVQGKIQTAVRVPIFGSDRLRLQPI